MLYTKDNEELPAPVNIYNEITDDLHPLLINAEFDKLVFLSHHNFTVDVSKLDYKLKSRYEIKSKNLMYEDRYYNRRIEIISKEDRHKYIIDTDPNRINCRMMHAKYMTKITQVPDDFKRKSILSSRIQMINEVCSEALLSTRYSGDTPDFRVVDDLHPRTLEVSLNFFVGEGEALRIRLFFLKHLNLKHSRSSHSHKNSDYIGKRNGTRSITSYNLAYKGIPREHRIELIMRGKECNQRKLKRPEDLLKIDWIEYVQKYIDFVTVDFEKLRKKLGSQDPEPIEMTEEFYENYDGSDITTELETLYRTQGLGIRQWIATYTRATPPIEGDDETVGVKGLSPIGQYLIPHPYKSVFDADVKFAFDARNEDLDYDPDLAAEYLHLSEPDLEEGEDEEDEDEMQAQVDRLIEGIEL